MNERKDVTTQETKTKDEPNALERAIRPAVDIFENETGIVLVADMPGVSKERLEVKLEKDTLSIEGAMDITMPPGMEPVYADIRSTRYQRSFSLSSELDGEKIEAGLKDGVLTLRIPKRAKYQPRKIEVRIT